MTLRHYLELLTQLTEEFPEYLDLDCVYSKDDEGNQFQKVVYAFSVGSFNDGEFEEGTPPNAICIN